MNEKEILIIAQNKSLEDLNGEEWRPVRQSLVYFVSNLGRVKSRNQHQMKILAQQQNNYGYWRACLSLEKNNPKYYLVSRLVAEAFSPDDEAELKEVHHRIDKNCNSADSLIFLTKEEHNEEHKKQTKEHKNNE